MFVFKSLILKRNKCAQKRKTLAEQGSVFIRLYSVPIAPHRSSTRGLAYDITLTEADGKSGVSLCDLLCKLVKINSLLNTPGGKLKLLKAFVPLNIFFIRGKQYVCPHVRPSEQL